MARTKPIMQYLVPKVRTEYWVAPDTKESWEKNLKDPIRSEYLYKQNWHYEHAIEYHYNSEGFRTDEFGTHNENFVALGCSFTFGTGLNRDHLWPELVSKDINLPVYNLGMYGAANDTCYRFAKHWLPILKPKFVVMLTPPIERIEFFNGETYKSYVPLENDDYGYFSKLYVTYNENSNLNLEKNLLAIQAICNSLNIPFYYNLSSEFHVIPDDNARDFCHQGPICHRNMADKFLDVIAY